MRLRGRKTGEHSRCKMGHTGGAELFKIPFNILLMAEDLLLLLQPDCHLDELLFLVTSVIGVLCKVNVQAFQILSVIVVYCPEQLN